MRLIDRQTVLGIHLRAPSVSRVDQDELRANFAKGMVFSAASQDERELIQKRVLSISGLIPSFDSFFNDCNYLESISNCIKWLIPGPVQITLRQTMQGHFLTSQLEFYKGYCSLAIFAMRLYDHMPKQPVLRDPLALAIARPDEGILREFAKLALSLGFGNDRINHLANSWAEHQIDLQVEFRQPLSLIFSDGPRVPEKRRSGRPHRCDYEYEQRFLTFDYLNDGGESEGREITPLFIRRAIYQNFFGRSGSTQNVSIQGSPARSASMYSTDWSYGESAASFLKTHPKTSSILARKKLSNIAEGREETDASSLGSRDVSEIMKPYSLRQAETRQAINRRRKGLYFAIGVPGRDALQWKVAKDSFMRRNAKKYKFWDIKGRFIPPNATLEVDSQNDESKIIVAQPYNSMKVDLPAFEHLQEGFMGWRSEENDVDMELASGNPWAKESPDSDL